MLNRIITRSFLKLLYLIINQSLNLQTSTAIYSGQKHTFKLCSKHVSQSFGTLLTLHPRYSYQFKSAQQLHALAVIKVKNNKRIIRGKWTIWNNSWVRYKLFREDVTENSLPIVFIERQLNSSVESNIDGFKVLIDSQLLQFYRIIIPIGFFLGCQGLNEFAPRVTIFWSTSTLVTKLVTSLLNHSWTTNWCWYRQTLTVKDLTQSTWLVASANQVKLDSSRKTGRREWRRRASLISI